MKRKTQKAKLTKRFKMHMSITEKLKISFPSNIAAKKIAKELNIIRTLRRQRSLQIIAVRW